MGAPKRVAESVHGHRDLLRQVRRETSPLRRKADRQKKLTQVTEHDGCRVHNFRRLVRRKQPVRPRCNALHAAMHEVAFGYDVPMRSVFHNGSNSVAPHGRCGRIAQKGLGPRDPGDEVGPGLGGSRCSGESAQEFHILCARITEVGSNARSSPPRAVGAPAK